MSLIEKGVCMLGDNCPFDHGLDPLVVGANVFPWSTVGMDTINPKQNQSLSQMVPGGEWSK